MLEIPKPCPIAWEQMSGTGTQRHCGQCNKTVHSLSDMDPASAAELLARAGAGGLCVRVRCDDEGVVLHQVRTEPKALQPRLRLALQPVLLSAGLLAAACNSPPSHRSHAEGRRSHAGAREPVRTPAGASGSASERAIRELTGAVAFGPPPKPEPPPGPCPHRDCDFESGF